ncbi:MBG domain-containing protein [Flaviaesturariibacter aridisoli]
MRAANDCFSGSSANSISFNTLLAPPSGSPATAIGCTQATANWVAVEGATGYRIDVANNSNFNSIVGRYNDSAVGNVTSFVISGLAPGKDYSYRVRTEKNGIFSNSSSSVSFSTLSGSPNPPGPIGGDKTVCSGEAGKVYSVPPVSGLTYQWTLPAGAVITAGDNSNSITVTFGSTSGDIVVTASNTCGTSSERRTGITVNLPATVSSEPGAQSITYGDTARFTTAASGTPAPTYRWQEFATSWNDLAEAGIYSGAAAGTLAVGRPGVALSGRKYRCIVSNVCGGDTTVERTLTVAARAITLTADTASRIYGNPDTAQFTAQVTGGTIVGSDAASGTLTRDPGENAGTYDIGKGTYSYGSNYAETFVSKLFTIRPRPITITAERKAKVYGDVDPELKATITGGIVGPDKPTGALSRAAGEGVGRYLIGQGSFTYGGNYAETYVEDSLFITPRPITIAANAAGKVYGDADSVLKAKITSGSIVFQDAFSGTLHRAEGEDAGSYAIEKGTYTYGTNYAETFVGATFAIRHRPLTIHVTAGQHKTYGEADPATFDFTLGATQSLAPWDAFSGSLSRQPGEDAGGYAILQAGLTIKNGNDDNTANYDTSYLGGFFSIDQRAITITADAASKTYGDNDPALTAQVTSGTVVTGDGHTGLLDRATGEAAGTYAISKGSYTYGSNYAETFVSALLTIHPRPITITANAAGKVYGDADSVLKARITSGNLVNNDHFAGALHRAEGEDVGNYAIDKGTYTYGTNYAETFVGADFTIRQRPLTINVTAGQHKTYGEADPVPFTYTIGASQSLAPWDAFSGALSRVPGDTVGTYDIVKTNLRIRNGSDDNTSNYDTTYNGSTFAIYKRPVTVKADAQSKIYGQADPKLTYTVTTGSVVPGDLFTGYLTRDAGVDVGKYAIRQGSLALSRNYDLTYVRDSLTILPVTISGYVGVPSPAYRQYSDSIIVRAEIDNGAAKIGGAPGAASSVTFRIGTQELGTVPFIANTDGDLVATLCKPLLETVSGELAPGSKVITATFNNPSSNYGLTTGNNSVTDRSFSIRKEDARVEYTGDQILSTGSATSVKATVKLRANILDITAVSGDAAYDPAPGDIRKAKARFVYGDSRIPLSGWLDVTLVGTDTKIGRIAFDSVFTLGNNETDREISIGVVVDYGYYYRDCSADNTVVTIYKPVGDFITGGGHIVPDKSVGTYKSDAGTKANFGFNVKYTKKGTSLQGNMNIVFRRTESDGLHTYQIKANSLQTLGVNISNPGRQTAQFSSKATLTDVTNPLAPVAKGGNKMLYVNMIDRGDPGNSDSISIVLAECNVDPGVLANVLYSSEWIANKHGQKELRGGNLVVKSGFSLTPGTTPSTGRTVATEQATATETTAKDDGATTLRFGLQAFPNPTQGSFTLLVQSDDARTPISLRIFDANGRILQQFTGLATGQTLRAGTGYARGTYVAELAQGTRRAVVKLLKE